MQLKRAFSINLAMAPHLRPKTRNLIRALIAKGFPPAAQARYSRRAVQRISVEDPIEMARRAGNRAGRRSRISKPIEEFISVLKKIIKRHWKLNRGIIAMNFKRYLE